MSFGHHGQGPGRGSVGGYEARRRRLQAYADAKTLQHEQDGGRERHRPRWRALRWIGRLLGTEETVD